MNRTFITAVATAVLLLVVPSPASASPGWLPDEVVVQDAPAKLLTDADIAFLDATGARVGDVLAVQWTEERRCGGYCPYAITAHGVAVEIPDGSIAVAPHGRDSDKGDTTYPIYDRLMAYDVDDDGLLNQGPYDQDPSGIGHAFVESPSRDLVWVSEQRATDDLTGEEWVRVAYGTTDAWVQEERLSEPTADDAPPADPVEEPEPVADPVEEPEPETTPVETTSETPQAAAPQEDKGGVPTGALLLGVLAAAVGGSLALRRRSGSQGGAA